jgi:hypothetical protein
VNTQTCSVRLTERLAADVGEGFARFAEGTVADGWPASGAGTGLPASGTELLDVAEALVDQQRLAGEVVRVIVQIAAVHAGIPPFVARAMGQAAGDLFIRLSGPDPNAGKVRVVQRII